MSKGECSLYVAAGAYPPRSPPNAWSPGVLAPPGPCYWLVASGTPLGWRRGCPTVWLVRGAVRHYCLGGCSALVVCARRSQLVQGGSGQCRVLCLPRFHLPAPRFPRCVWRAVLSRFPLSSLAVSCGLCVLRAWSGCPSGIPRVSCACACARALAASAPPPPPMVGVARAPRAVSMLGAGSAVPRGPCSSACPASVPCSVWLAHGGGRPSPLPPLPGLGLYAPFGAPQSARSCELALRAVGLARGRQEGGRLLPVCGASGSGALPPRNTRPLKRAAGAH